MRVVISGQKRFGRDTFDLVTARGWEIAAVFAPEGDDKLRTAATNASLPVFGAKQLTAALMPASCDLIIAAHCHTYISKPARLRAKLGALGYHPSLLPRHRGRSAIEWALRHDEHVTGGTVFWLNDVVDGGPIAAQEHCAIRPGDTALDLWSRELAPLGLRLFSQVFDELERGIIRAEPQDPALATWEPALEGVPPLWRPDAPMLGDGTPSGFKVITRRHEAAE